MIYSCHIPKILVAQLSLALTVLSVCFIYHHLLEMVNCAKTKMHSLIITFLLLSLFKLGIMTEGIKASATNSTIINKHKNGNPRSSKKLTDDLFKFGESGQSVKCYNQKTMKLYLKCLNKVIEKQDEKISLLKALVIIGAGKLLYENN